VEGLKVDAPQLARFVVPVSVLILIGLFLVQRKGTGFIGKIFGPAMLLWSGNRHPRPLRDFRHLPSWRLARSAR
jgi:hypothetical protein